MKNYDKNIESSDIEYSDSNSLYGQAMSQKLPVNNFKWVGKNNLSKLNGTFIKNYDENSDKGYMFEVDVEYPKKLVNLYSDLPFLPERKKIGKCNKLVCTVQDNENYVVHVRALKQALNHELILKKSAQCNSI